MKKYENVLPEGAYILELLDVEPMTYRSGSNGYRLLWRLAQTDRLLWSFLSNADGARWTWRQFGIPSMEDVRMLIGRKYLVVIRVDVFNEKEMNQIASILAEVYD